MKLKHRLFGLALVVVLLFFIYLLASDDILPDISVKTRQLAQGLAAVQRNNGPGQDVCQFSQRLIPKNGIHTQALFDAVSVDDGQQPVRFSAKEEAVSRRKPLIFQEPLRVYLIPHSHNDPGWLKTLNRYYIEQTKEILDNMVVKLNKYRDMTFVWSETVFLSLWWKDITDETKEQVKALIQRGQLELVTGGWVDPDEATTHYVDIVDEMMEGHRWLEKNIGVRPEVYWAPDPFGYSATMPFLVKRAGFKRMVILRIHDEVKGQLREKQNLEFFWRQTWDRSDRDTDMFTHILPYVLYSIKHSCGPDPYVCLMFDFRRIPGEYSEANPPTLDDANIDTYARYLVDQFRAKALHFRQNVIFMPLGDDFRYDRSVEWDQQYKNYKRLFDYINKQKDWNIQATFGTPSEYFRTLENEKKYYRHTETAVAGDVGPRPRYPVLYGDFYPYMDRDEEYWTGFYTTRPFWKGLGRELQADLRSAEILNSLACAYARYKLSNFHALLSNLASLDTARQSLSLFQHHDAVTGTSKPEVVLDYGDRLWKAKKLTHRVKMTSLAYLLSSGKVQLNTTVVDGQLKVGTYVIDVDDARNTDSPGLVKTFIPLSYEGTKVIFFNSLAHSRKELVRLRVGSSEILVADHEGNPIRSQLLPLWRNHPQPLDNDYELIFFADIQGFGLRTYVVKKVRQNLAAQFVGKGLTVISSLSSTETNLGSWKEKDNFDMNSIVIKNDFFTANFDKEWGLLHSLKLPAKEVRCDIRFLSYTSSRSGAYLFYPQGKARESMFTRDPGVSPAIYVVRGPISSEVRVAWQFLTHVARVLHTTQPQGRAVELVNEFDISGDSNFFSDKEIIMRIHTDIKNGREFFTDLNGYQMRRRKVQEKFHIAGNYYPMTSMTYLQDNTTRLSLLSKQSHGVSSLRQGYLEVMLDRKLNFDDNRGLGEGIYDNLPTTVKFRLLVELGPLPVEDSGKNSYPSLLSHELSHQLLYPISNFYQLVYETPFAPVFSSLALDLPCDLHIVNLKTMFSPHDQNILEVALVMTRLGFQCNYPSKGLSCSVDSQSPTFGEIFTDLKIAAVKERTLSLMYRKSSLSSDAIIPLLPMDIATFLLTFK